MSISPSVDLFFHEKKAWQRGLRVAGLDEAGRGAWAGPVVAAVAVFEPGVVIDGVNDSKILSPKKRDELFEEIRAKAAGFGVGMVEAGVIDQINILQATRKAMVKSLKMLALQPDLLLIDGNMSLDVNIPQKAIIDGDALSFSIAAASILAKVTRDRIMADLSRVYPAYGFERHKGYGTKIHREALSKVGCSAIHRYSYAPVAQIFKSGRINEKA